jgi:nucleoside transporter
MNTLLAPPPLSAGLNFRLSTMMFLQYAIWGAWLPLLWPFLTEHRGLAAGEVGNIFAVGAIGAIIAPFIAGQIADRWFSTEKFLAISHILGGALVWQLATIDAYGGFLIFSLIYSVIYSPTLSLTNSLSFHHLPDRDRDFGKVRIWGTVGWIAAGIAIGQWLLHSHTPANETKEVIQAAQFAGMADAFRLSGILGVLMGFFCFALPNTPPSQGQSRSATREAWWAIRKQPLLTLFLLAVPVSCIHQFYFVHTAGFLGNLHASAEGLATKINAVLGVGGGGLMTIGQMSELLVLALIPTLAKSLSRKTLLAIGLIAYAGRMALFANADAVGLSGVLAGVALHGLCFGCFIFVAFMIVDEETTDDVRASAQSLFNLVIIGIGIIVGSQIATKATEWATIDGDLSFNELFSYPMYASLVCLLVLVLFYPSKGNQELEQ